MSNPMDKATERPWSYNGDYILDTNGDRVAVVGDSYECSPEDLARDDANAALIVHSVNSLPVALKALEEAKDLLRRYQKFATDPRNYHEVARGYAADSGDDHWKISEWYSKSQLKNETDDFFSTIKDSANG